MQYSTLEQFSIECQNQIESNYHNQTTYANNTLNQLQLKACTSKGKSMQVKASHDWFRFYFLYERVFN